mmetsp:Transcript_23158/g.37192  ORF Transcript_23158/g.37192 Transcript_23158/m.37192 type:complete len:105 (+) Transcript_23158:840-1154(+)
MWHTNSSSSGLSIILVAMATLDPPPPALTLSPFVSLRISVSIQGAAKRAVEKLHRRCPYIFGAERVETIEEARAVWQRVKREEQQREEEEEVEREGAKSAKALE